MDNKPKFLIVGASIAGLAAATTLSRNGKVNPIIYERSSYGTINRRPRNGGGIGLDSKSIELLKSIGISTALGALPMTFQEDRDRTGRIIRKKRISFSSAYWGGVYKSLYESTLAAGVEIHHGYKVINVKESTESVKLFFSDGSSVVGDYVIGADGILSTIRSCMFPNEADNIRHSGYYAWRGLAKLEDFSKELKQEVESDIRRDTITMEISEGSHAIFYYLSNGLNWLIYLNRDERGTPQYQSRHEVTGAITKESTQSEVEEFYQKIGKLYRPFISEVIRTTNKPFLNQIYDRDVLSSYITKRCVLIGDAAHPPTPHFIRGTNMALQNAFALAKSIEKTANSSCNDAGWIETTFLAYQEEELERCNNILLISRRLGRVKQGVFVNTQNVNWAVNCTCQELDNMLQDNEAFA